MNNLIWSLVNFIFAVFNLFCAATGSHYEIHIIIGSLNLVAAILCFKSWLNERKTNADKDTKA